MESARWYSTACVKEVMLPVAVTPMWGELGWLVCKLVVMFHDPMAGCLWYVHSCQLDWTWKFTNQPASYALLIFPFCLLSVHTHLWGEISFSYAASSVWNSRSCKVRSSNTFTSFKSSFKFHLFRLFYWLCVCVCGGGGGGGLCFVMGCVL